MTASNESFQHEASPQGSAYDGTVTRVVIVDEDPIFRSGMATWLQHYPDFEVIEGLGYGAIALERLQSYRRAEPDAPLLIIFGGPLQFPSLSQANNYSNLRAWCRDIKATDPEVRVVIVGVDHHEAFDIAYQAKADGYLCKVWWQGDILRHLRQAAVGQFQWSWQRASDGIQTDDYPSAQPQSLARPQSQYPSQSPTDGMGPSPSDQSMTRADADQISQKQTIDSVSSHPPLKIPQGPLAQVRFRLRLSGLEEIDSQLNQLLPYLNLANSDRRYYISLIDRWIIAGRCRELRAARWAVAQILATPSLDSLDAAPSYRSSRSSSPTGVSHQPVAFRASDASGSSMDTTSMMVSNPSPGSDGGVPPEESLWARWQRQLVAIAQQPIYQATSNRFSTDQKAVASHNLQGNQQGNRQGNLQGNPQGQRSEISVTPSGSSLSAPDPISLTPISVRATLFDALRDRLQSPLINQTEHPLEIDILREEKKRELLVLVLHKILVLLDDLRYSDVQPQQLQERRSQLFYDLWQSILTDYFGKYYVVQVDGVEREVVAILSQEARAVQSDIFDRIPFAMDLLAHFLFKSPLEIDSVPYSLGTPEAIERAEILLDNLVLQMANSVIYPLLNYLADVELIKQNFYQRQLMSSREIARFRNTLSWHYRRKQLIEEPTAIFESTYPLFALNGMGIKQVHIYASRRSELDQLSGLPLIVTLLLEFRDALSPRLRGAIAAVGSGVIYVLTDVIGRSIGLVARGIIKGIGSAWKDFK